MRVEFQPLLDTGPIRCVFVFPSQACSLWNQVPWIQCPDTTNGTAIICIYLPISWGSARGVNVGIYGIHGVSGMGLAVLWFIYGFLLIRHT